MKFHISEAKSTKGMLLRCRAVTEPCPYSGHFASREEVMAFVKSSGKPLTISRTDYDLTYSVSEDGSIVKTTTLKKRYYALKPPVVASWTPQTDCERELYEHLKDFHYYKNTDQLYKHLEKVVENDKPSSERFRELTTELVDELPGIFGVQEALDWEPDFSAPQSFEDYKKRAMLMSARTRALPRAALSDECFEHAYGRVESNNPWSGHWVEQDLQLTEEQVAEFHKGIREAGNDASHYNFMTSSVKRLSDFVERREERERLEEEVRIVLEAYEARVAAGDITPVEFADEKVKDWASERYVKNGGYLTRGDAWVMRHLTALRKEDPELYAEAYKGFGDRDHTLKVLENLRNGLTHNYRYTKASPQRDALERSKTELTVEERVTVASYFARVEFVDPNALERVLKARAEIEDVPISWVLDLEFCTDEEEDPDKERARQLAVREAGRKASGAVRRVLPKKYTSYVDEKRVEKLSQQ